MRKLFKIVLSYYALTKVRRKSNIKHRPLLSIKEYFSMHEEIYKTFMHQTGTPCDHHFQHDSHCVYMTQVLLSNLAFTVLPLHFLNDVSQHVLWMIESLQGRPSGCRTNAKTLACLVRLLAIWLCSLLLSLITTPLLHSVLPLPPLSQFLLLALLQVLKNSVQIISSCTDPQTS